MLPKIDTILYCTGLGPNAEHIFRYAYSLAQQFGAKIVALHVMETLSRRQRAMVEGYSGLGSLSELLEKAKRDAATALPKRIEELCKLEAPDADWRQIVAEVILAEGHVAEEILELVEAKGADIVVIGVHGESSLTLGSTARRLVRECPVPVLTVRVPEGE
jgi:nucleotide-binding universal stress UspA family protein